MGIKVCKKLIVGEMEEAGGIVRHDIHGPWQIVMRWDIAVAFLME